MNTKPTVSLNLLLAADWPQKASVMARLVSSKLITEKLSQGITNQQTQNSCNKKMLQQWSR